MDLPRGGADQLTLVDQLTLETHERAVDLAEARVADSWPAHNRRIVLGADAASLDGLRLDVSRGRHRPTAEVRNRGGDHGGASPGEIWSDTAHDAVFHPLVVEDEHQGSRRLARFLGPNHAEGLARLNRPSRDARK
jgi:hypothetical protein